MGGQVQGTEFFAIMKQPIRVRSNAPVSWRDLDRLYDHGYFHGETSGYSTQGYRNCHPDWSAWLELVQAVKPGGRLLDLGCAYGLSISSARSAGFEAFGFDISSYALRQEADQRGQLLQSDLHLLPVRSGTADVVLILDVLEHLADPVQGLEEAVRVLAPDGLLVGATPDPIFFGRSESTHFSERPPSFWVSQLAELGLFAAFRFSVVPYNFQFLACRAESPLASRVALFQHDYFSEETEFANGEGLRVVPRWGWGTLNEKSRSLQENGASVYLLNQSAAPVSCEIDLTVSTRGAFSTLGIRLDSWLLHEAVLNSEQTEYAIHLEDVPVPAGGHHLFFDLAPGGVEVTVRDVRIRATKMSSEELVRDLPFDLYQRYQGVAELISVVEPGSLLDVGGYIGDAGGHLAVSADFLSGPSGNRLVRSTDFRQCDHPDHIASEGTALPFPDAAFEAVVSLDVLEHITPANRERFLAELERVAQNWVVVAAPFNSPEAERAEHLLSSGVMHGHGFLDEHRELGLPDGEAVRLHCKARGYPCWQVPNGNIDNWVLLQTLNALFFGSRSATIARTFNRIYSERLFPKDHAVPCYRSIFLLYIGAGEPPNERVISGQIERLLAKRRSSRWDLSDLILEPAFQEVVRSMLTLGNARARALSDVQFLANSRTDHIGLLLKERDSLVEQLEQTPLAELAKRRWKQRRGRHGKKQDD